MRITDERKQAIEERKARLASIPHKASILRDARQEVLTREAVARNNGDFYDARQFQESPEIVGLYHVKQRMTKALTFLTEEELSHGVLMQAHAILVGAKSNGYRRVDVGAGRFLGEDPSRISDSMDNALWILKENPWELSPEELAAYFHLK